VDALLVPRGALAENAYKALVKAVVRPVQAAGTAVLVEGEPGLVRLLGADGLHVPGGIGALKAAVQALKPDFIVGAGEVETRHDAMARGELDIDYILFGPLSGSIGEQGRELARWWAQTMEVPSVLCDPDTGAPEASEGCEFVGLSLARLEQG
jgi:thiamine-phosphate pyrophosphorylase